MISKDQANNKDRTLENVRTNSKTYFLNIFFSVDRTFDVAYNKKFIIFVGLGIRK